MNKERLLKLADAIESADQSENSRFAFDMECFYVERDVTDHPCGTAACIQGWAQHTDPDNHSWLYSLDTFTCFAIWAGIEKWQAEEICAPHRFYLMEQEHAVEMLRRFVRIGEVAWDV